MGFSSGLICGLYGIVRFRTLCVGLTVVLNLVFLGLAFSVAV